LEGYRFVKLEQVLRRGIIYWKKLNDDDDKDKDS